MFKRISMCLVALVASTSLTLMSVYASQNFSVSPPPIPWFEFQKGQTDARINAMYMSIENEEADMSLKGGGANILWRYAFTDMLAVDVGLGAFGGGGPVGYTWPSGNTGTTGMGFFFAPAQLDLEFKPVQTESFTLILFGGVTRNWGYTAISDSSTTISLIGLQFGAQASIVFGTFAVSPFILIQKIGGTATTSGTTTDIESYTAKIYGIDFVFIPYDLTLSSLLQMQPAEQGDTRMIYLSASYDFRWGVEERTVKIPSEKTQPKTSQKRSSESSTPSSKGFIFAKIGYIPLSKTSFETKIRSTTSRTEYDDLESRGPALNIEYNHVLNDIWFALCLEYQYVIGKHGARGIDSTYNIHYTYDDVTLQFIQPMAVIRYFMPIDDIGGSVFGGIGLSIKYLLISSTYKVAKIDDPSITLTSNTDREFVKKYDFWGNVYVGYLRQIGEYFGTVELRFGYNFSKNQFSEIEYRGGTGERDVSNSYDLGIYLGIGYRVM